MKNFLLAAGVKSSAKDARTGEAFFANGAVSASESLAQPLNNFSTGVNANDSAADMREFIAPSIECATRFTYRTWPRAQSVAAPAWGDLKRARGGELPTVALTGAEAEGKLDEYGICIPIDKSDKADDPMLFQKVSEAATRKLNVAELIASVAALDALAVSTTITISSQSSDFDEVIMAAIETAGDTAGIDPNRIVFGGKAWGKRRKWYKDNVRNGGGSWADTLERFSDEYGIHARAFQARELTSAGLMPVVASNVIYAFHAEDGMMFDDPSNLKTATQGGDENFLGVDSKQGLVEYVRVMRKRKILPCSSSGVVKIIIA